MPARAVRPHGRLARWASVLSYRTISGKLIIGLVVLFGLASAVVSVVTAQSLNDSLMSTLRTQVQSATSTWFTCASPDNHSPGGDPDHDQQSPPGCYDSGQAPDTFLAILSSSGKVEQYYYVGGSCTLTAADQAMLPIFRLPTRLVRIRRMVPRRIRRPIPGRCPRSASSSCSPRCRGRITPCWLPGCR